jgi:nucleoside-diphosphate-sugar epimerase
MEDLLDYFADTGSRPTVLFAGSSSQVGVPGRLPVDGTETDHPCTAYDRHKLAAERLLTSASRDGVVRGATLRLSTVFGCGPKAGAADRGVLAAMTRRALDGEPLTVWDRGEIRRDFVHVRDVAAAFASALDHDADLGPGHWLVGSGQAHSLLEAFRAISRIVSRLTARPPVGIRSVPAPSEATPTDLHSMAVDPAAFRAATGWRPRVSLAAGLSQLAAETARRTAGSAVLREAR